MIRMSIAVPLVLFLAVLGGCSDDDPARPVAADPSRYLVLEGNFPLGSEPGSSLFEPAGALLAPVLDFDYALSTLRSELGGVTDLDLDDVRLEFSAVIDGSPVDLGTFTATVLTGEDRGEDLQELVAWCEARLASAGVDATVDFYRPWRRPMLEFAPGAPAVERVVLTRVDAISTTEVLRFGTRLESGALVAQRGLIGPARPSSLVADVIGEDGAPLLIVDGPPDAQPPSTEFVLAVEDQESPLSTLTVSRATTTMQDVLAWIDDTLEIGDDGTSGASLDRTTGGLRVVGRLGPEFALPRFRVEEDRGGARIALDIRYDVVRDAAAIAPIVAPFRIVDSTGASHDLTLRFVRISRVEGWLWSIESDGPGQILAGGSGRLEVSGAQSWSWTNDTGGNTFSFLPGDGADPVEILFFARSDKLTFLLEPAAVQATALAELVP